MSIIIRNQRNLFRHILGTSRRQIFQQHSKYSQQNVLEPVVNRKKKYIYTAFIGTSLIAFSYYVYKEKEYGNFIVFPLDVHSNAIACQCASVYAKMFVANP